jgi:2-polyprenyl-6-methoxyphenol hydroxylase-like FAD-dependent oxidoreductase
VVGADGVRSKVRENIGVEMHGKKSKLRLACNYNFECRSPKLHQHTFQVKTAR